MTSTMVLRHVPFEDLGAFASVLERRSSVLNIYDVGVVDMWALDPVKLGLAWLCRADQTAGNNCAVRLRR